MKNKNWQEEFELARRRCSETIDLDQDPPTLKTYVSCSTAISEINRLEKILENILKAKQIEEAVKKGVK